MTNWAGLRAALADQIADLEKRIDALANRSGVGRTALVEGERELVRMRKKLADLKQQAGLPNPHE